MQLIYASQPFGYDELTLVGISAAALRNNARDGITGAVICRGDLLVQLLAASSSDWSRSGERPCFEWLAGS